jgi:hypothetical protein
VTFATELRKQHPQHERRFDELEEFFRQYGERLKRRYVSRDERPARLLGHRGALLLLQALSRARFLTATIIHSANGGLVVGMHLASRAHWEMTGMVAHLLALLQKHCANTIAEPEFERMLKRLAMARRWAIPDGLKEDVDAINALTLVGSAAKLFGEVFGPKIGDHISTCYDVLSEYCHPNLMGRQAGTTLSTYLMVVDFDAAFSLTEGDLALSFSHGLSSQKLFFYAYDESFRLLNEHEEMPRLEG